MHVYMYIYIYIHAYVSVAAVSRSTGIPRADTRSVFYNSKSQNIKLSVSNPKNKYVAYVSVLSQISIARV